MPRATSPWRGRVWLRRCGRLQLRLKRLSSAASPLSLRRPMALRRYWKIMDARAVRSLLMVSELKSTIDDAKQ